MSETTVRGKCAAERARRRDKRAVTAAVALMAMGASDPQEIAFLTRRTSRWVLSIANNYSVPVKGPVRCPMCRNLIDHVPCLQCHMRGRPRYEPSPWWLIIKEAIAKGEARLRDIDDVQVIEWRFKEKGRTVWKRKHNDGLPDHRDGFRFDL